MWFLHFIYANCCIYIFYHSTGKEHWLGLDNIFQLTNRQDVKMQLKIDMERFSGEKATVKYDNFYLETQVLQCTEFSIINKYWYSRLSNNRTLCVY